MSLDTIEREPTDAPEKQAPAETAVAVASHNISGRVFDEEGSPTSAMIVAIGVDERVAEVHRTDADGDGAFSLDLPEWTWWLHAERGDRMSRPRRADSDERYVEDDLDLRLAPTGRVWGFVYDPDGRPLAAARVLSRTRPEWTGPSSQGNRRPQPAPSCYSETDSSGRYELRACEGEVVVQAEANDFAAACVEGEVVADLAVQLDIRLSHGLIPQGRVTNTSGRPIAGADVFIRHEGGADWSPYPERYYLVTDSEGMYRSPVSWAGWFSVNASMEGYIRATGKPEEKGSSSVDLTLVRAGFIEGAVRVHGGGPPGAGTKLGLRLASAFGNKFSPCDEYLYGRKSRLGADGAFHLEAIGPGRYVVQARIEGSALGESVEFDVAEGEGVEGVVVDLRPSCVVRGTVRSARSGEPVPRAGVDLLALKEGNGGHMARAKSDAQGRFEIRDVAPGSHRIRASQGSVVSSEILIESREGQVLERDILLGEGTRVHGRVVLDGAVPKGSIEVRAQTSDYRGSGIVKRAADGSYEIQGIGAGAWFIWVSFYPKDSKGHYRLVRLIEVGPEEDIEIDFDLRSTPWARGTVSQVGGLSGAGAIAFVGQGPLDGWTWVALLGESGDFTVAGLPTGDYVVIDGHRFNAVLDPATGRYRIPCGPVDPVIHLTGGDVDSLLILLPTGR